MKILFCAIIFALSISLAAAQETKRDIKDLSWMTGCWEMSDKGEIVAEQWTKPAGQTMFGISRTIKNEKTTGFEFLRIVQNADGVFYIARPSGAKEDTSFKLTKLAEKEAVFENPEHDFPQTIIYRLVDANSLTARVEAKAKNGKVSGFDIPMKKAKCD
jgi:hypothetical protein